MKLELRDGRRDDDQESNYANRLGQLVAPDRLRGVTKHARRLVKIDLVPVHSAEISVCKERGLDATRYDAPASATDAAAVAATATSDEPPVRPVATGSPALSLIVRSETELRAMLGAPTSEEDHPPVNGGVIETGNAPWMSSSTRMSRQNSSELLRTR